MGRLLLIDTNVWLGNYLPSRRGHDECRTFLRVAREHDASLLYPAPILKDVFYLIGQEFKRQVQLEKGAVSEEDAGIIRRLAWGCIDNMRELATAVGVDESDIWLACKYRTLSGDLEDNVVIAAAQRAKADHLVTLDQALVRKAPVSALSPQDMTTLLELV